MRSITSQWFECTVKYEKTMEDGVMKKVKEQYVVDSLSFSEAEERITDEMSTYISGEFEVAALKIAPYKEIFFADSDAADRWYKVKVNLITIDERTCKEKKSAITYLVNAGTTDTAQKNVHEIMSGTMIDYEITSVIETKILDVFEYESKSDSDSDKN